MQTSQRTNKKILEQSKTLTKKLKSEAAMLLLNKKQGYCQ